MKELARYIAVSVDRKVIVDEGLARCVPVPKVTTTFGSFTNPKEKSKDTCGDSQFHRVQAKPSQIQVTQIIANVTVNTVCECMKHHYYTFDDKIRQQEDGGAIGSKLTGKFPAR